MAYYHCVSRIVDRRFVLEATEKEMFVRIMRGYEVYCGVRIITFCVMSNWLGTGTFRSLSDLGR